jgi:SAM-dependent methyltransferase
VDERPNADFKEHAADTRRIWDVNARWWDDQIGGGNDFQDLLIEPATERLLAIAPGDVVLDIACGAGRFARRIATRGARVVAFDHSTEFVARARERTPADIKVEYRVVDASSIEGLLALGSSAFDKAVCTMALMDMPSVTPLFSVLPRLLRPGGCFVFSVTHPCFHGNGAQRFAEAHEESHGRQVMQTGVKVSSYLSPRAYKSEGIVGQPEPHWVFHRPLSVLLEEGFAAGFVVDGFEEPRLAPRDGSRAGVGWHDMPEIPPVLVARMRLAR